MWGVSGRQRDNNKEWGNDSEDKFQDMRKIFLYMIVITSQEMSAGAIECLFRSEKSDDSTRM